MPYILKTSKTQYTLTDQETNQTVLTLPLLKPLELCYKIVKQLLYKYAWNRSPSLPQEVKSQHELLIIMLSWLAKKPPANPTIQAAYEAAKENRQALKAFLITQESTRKEPIAFDSDYSDDSDDEAETADNAANDYRGSDAAFQNPRLTTIRNRLKQRLRSQTLSQTSLIKNEAQAFRNAIALPYQAHLQSILAERANSITRIDAIRKVANGYALICRDADDREVSIPIQHEPHILLSRGIGYFADRWDSSARRAHRQELSPHPLYAQAVLMRLFDPGASYAEAWTDLEEEQREHKAKILHRYAKELKGNLIRLRRSMPLIVKLGSSYRIFDNWLAYLQYLYTNGIERFILFVKQLQEKVQELKGLFPELGNMFNSCSELLPHALRYAMGIKEPYSENALDIRRDNQGKPENPYLGKLYTTSHPLSDFSTWSRPHVVRELSYKKQVTTTSFIGPELEVSFLSSIPQSHFASAQKVRLPSFAYAAYPPHYQVKYGIDAELYTLIYQVCLKNNFNHPNRIALENYLREYIAFYHAVRHTLLSFSGVSAQQKLILFLNSQGGFTTKLPVWQRSGKSDFSQQHTEAKRILETHYPSITFYSPKDETYASKALTIYIIEPEWLSTEFKNIYENNRAAFFGDRKPRDSLDSSDMLDDSFDFSKPDQSDLSRNDDDTSFLFRDFSDYSSDDEKSFTDGLSPMIVNLPDEEQAYWDIDVKGDGNCLFYSLIVGLLLPHINNQDQFNHRYFRLFGENDNDGAADLFQAFQSYQGHPSWAQGNLQHRVTRLREHLANCLISETDDSFIANVRYAFQSDDNTIEAIVRHLTDPSRSWSNEMEMLLFMRYIGVRIREFYRTPDGENRLAENTNELLQVIQPTQGIELLDDEVIVYFTSPETRSNNNHFHCFIRQSNVPEFSQRVQAAQSEIDGVSFVARSCKPS